MNTDNFKKLGLIEPILRALSAENITDPTPIQRKAIPLILEGRDVMGVAQTGSGKTAAFALPMLQLLLRTRTSPVRGSTRALVLVPTRELADQVAGCIESFGRFVDLRVAAVYGGISRSEQITVLSKGVDILVATPGRLMDLMEDRKILLARTEMFVLDEADRMLDMGFIPDIKKISIALPARRQTSLFSATIPPVIMALAANLLRQPEYVEITSDTREDPEIDQKVMFVHGKKKSTLLLHLLRDRRDARVLVFTRTKERANTLAGKLSTKRVNTDAIHSDKPQSARQKALESFHSGHIRVLVATDIAARGIDVEDIDLVINYDLPIEPELYIHRIGRTARAGKRGAAVSFCEASEKKHLRQIEKVVGRQLPVSKDQPFHSTETASDSGSAPGKGSSKKGPAPKNSSGKKRGRRRPSRNRRDSSHAPARGAGSR
jgi:ATP-dependent RNA helicase RhlE